MQHEVQPRFWKRKYQKGELWAPRVRVCSETRDGCWGRLQKRNMSVFCCLYLLFCNEGKNHDEFHVLNVTQLSSVFMITHHITNPRTHRYSNSKCRTALTCTFNPVTAITDAITCSVLWQIGTLLRSFPKCVQCACFHAYSIGFAAHRGYKVHSVQSCTCSGSLLHFHNDRIFQYPDRNTGKM